MNDPKIKRKLGKSNKIKIQPEIPINKPPIIENNLFVNKIAIVNRLKGNIEKTKETEFTKRKLQRVKLI